MIWPLSALLTWAGAWGVFWGLRAIQTPFWAGLSLACALGLILGLLERSSWRRFCIAGGFPLSLAASGLGTGFPAWIWLIPLGFLLLLYPLRAWRDAPLFPTPPGALEGLDRVAPLPEDARILDAGCGLGDGLKELHRIYPQARLTGLEWSWPLRLVCGLRCPSATVRRADIWREDWSGYDLIYMFQRPESMTPAIHKARAELRATGWLVSLEFEAASLAPTAVLRNRTDKPVWVYRMDEPLATIVDSDIETVE